MYNKQHLISLLGYMGIGFIGGSISHGFFSGTRSILMAILGIMLFVISESLKEGEKNYGHLILGGLIYSIAVGMVSGGFQHFLDSPERSLWIIPLGWIVSTIIFPYKEGLTKVDYIKSISIGLLISILLGGILYAAMHVIPTEIFATGDHHETGSHQEESHLIPTKTITTGTIMETNEHAHH